MALRPALVVLALLLVAACGAPVPGPSAPAALDVAGSWTGRLELPGMPMDIGVTLAGRPRVPAGIRAMPLADVAPTAGWSASPRWQPPRGTVPAAAALGAGTAARSPRSRGPRPTARGRTYRAGTLTDHGRDRLQALPVLAVYPRCRTGGAWP